MAGNNNGEKEPPAAPEADRWYDLTLGSSFKNPSSKVCTLRYEFKPASIDKNQPGSLHKNKDNRVTVEFNNLQPGKPKVAFEGNSEDCKESDAVLFFDGETFRLERLHRAVNRLRHVRQRGESAAATTSLGPAADSDSPPPAKVAKLQHIKNIPPPIPVEVERIEVGDFRSSDAKFRNEKLDSSLGQPKAYVASPEQKDDDLDEQLDAVNEEVDILNDDDDDNIGVQDGGRPATEKEFFRGIDINMPHQNETDEENADVDISDGEDKGPNAAEALRAQLNPEGEEERDEQTSSSSSSGSESSGSSSKSGSSGEGSSSSDSEKSDGDSINSI